MPEEVRAPLALVAQAIELVGGGAIVAGVLLVIGTIVNYLARRGEPFPYEVVRLRFGRSLGVALEFMAAAGILKTALAVTVEQIAIVASIIALRTILGLSIRYELGNLQAYRSTASSRGRLEQRKSGA